MSILKRVRLLVIPVKALWAGLVMLAFFSALPVFGNTITVSNVSDSGSGSLRAAIASALSGDTINFSVTGTITLTGGELAIGKDLMISGPGASNLAISGNNSSRVFNIGSAATVTISGLTIQNGSAYEGAGILNYGTLTLTNSAVSGNSSTYYGGGIENVGTLTLTASAIADNFAHGAGGGGIFNNTGTLAVNYSTLSGNSGNRDAGGIYNFNGIMTVTNSTFSSNSASTADGGTGGGIFNNNSTMTLTNCTFSGNSAYEGGGIYNYFGTMKLANCTFSSNSAFKGGGFYNSFGSGTLKSTILANSLSGGNGFVFSGTLTSQGHNLSDDMTCSSFVQAGDMNGIPSGLDPSGLQNNGGPTKTIALLAASPAVDAIPVTDCTDVDLVGVTADQRGVARPQGTLCDIGAFEFVPYTAVAIDYFLHSGGSTLFLDNIAPTSTAAQFKDSAGLQFSDGNPWKEIGAWATVPGSIPVGSEALTALSDLHVWLGLKNSDDQGARFDLRAEIFKNGVLVSSGEAYCITGVTRNPNSAKEVVVSFGPISDGAIVDTDELSLRVLARIGTSGGVLCGGHSSAVGLRLYFDSASRQARFGGTFQTTP